VEGHLGRDEKFYLLDLARTFPPECGVVCQHLPEHKQSIFYRLLRPEFLRYLKNRKYTSTALADITARAQRHVDTRTRVQKQKLRGDRTGTAQAQTAQHPYVFKLAGYLMQLLKEKQERREGKGHIRAELTLTNATQHKHRRPQSRGKKRGSFRCVCNVYVCMYVCMCVYVCMMYDVWMYDV